MRKVVKAEEGFSSFLVLALHSKYPSTFAVMMPILVGYPLQ